jgi:hypothetical protein
MQNEVQQGMLSGRPYGGVMTMINNHLRSQTETNYCTDRLHIVRGMKNLASCGTNLLKLTRAGRPLVNLFKVPSTKNDKYAD